MKFIATVFVASMIYLRSLASELIVFFRYHRGAGVFFMPSIGSKLIVKIRGYEVFNHGFQRQYV